ncbi:fn3 domain-containing protein/DUF1423 domain-containing protein [Cephalotus follicularis]|uniref:Fn3 domain-containing protein/DUF1423 domain-containing protein n=1 Tax=Cephalotus follicularis TaxID=3775 RepID=A0A1Q3CZI9_CEPFO|nr:fn3 domain-containing protein/DUF1423 domain-containing protein [Cephalotus follicularis]
MATDSSFEGDAFDPSKCSNWSIDEKREFVYELSKRSHGASEMLQSWSRQEILQILCAEMGKERKYTGLTKLKIIENLLKIVSEKTAGEHDAVEDHELQSSPALGERTSKRQRKNDHPTRLTVPLNELTANNDSNDSNKTVYCKNSACKASLRQEDAFCKRCSCCICCRYDDNKDPSLWLLCSSEPPFQGDSCGMSCHLECALKNERAGIGKDRQHAGLDGSFHCVSCGKVNDLLGCWRKQLMVAKDTRRVDILCYRVSLGQKLLNGTEKYKKLREIVDEAVKKLEAEVGFLTGLPVKMGRGIVNRLSSGPEVQKLCAFAVELLDQMLSRTILHLSQYPIMQDSKLTGDMIRFEDVCPTSLTVILGYEEPLPGNYIGYSLWHRKAYDVGYPVKSTCTVFAKKTRFVVTGLAPATEYYFKVVSFNGTRQMGTCEVRYSTSSCGNDVSNGLVVERSQSPATNCSSLSNPSSVEDETNNVVPYSDQNDDRADNYITYSKNSEKTISANLNDTINCPVLGEGGTAADVVFLSDAEHAMEVAGSMHNTDVLKIKHKHLIGDQILKVIGTDNGLDAPIQTRMESMLHIGSSEAELPITPCKTEAHKDGQGRNGRSKSSIKDLDNGTGKGEDPQDGSTSKKSGERRDEDRTANGLSNRDFEHCVKMIRWLECEGHIEKNFRQKFLTWYSLRATPQEVRIVKVFVDTFIEDPASLAEQLVDTFSESVSSSKRSSVVPPGFCMKLWH